MFSIHLHQQILQISISAKAMPAEHPDVQMASNNINYAIDNHIRSVSVLFFYFAVQGYRETIANFVIIIPNITLI